MDFINLKSVKGWNSEIYKILMRIKFFLYKLMSGHFVQPMNFCPLSLRANQWNLMANPWNFMAKLLYLMVNLYISNSVLIRFIAAKWQQ